MDTWLSWTIILVIGGAAYWYYGTNDNRRRPRGRTLQRAADTARAKDEPARQWSDSDVATKASAKAPKAKPSRKSVKKAVQEVGVKVDAALSTTSSAGGADADDDLSPAVSPAFGAASIKPPSGKDVSDMLEPRSGTPSVLRLTPTSQPERPKKQQAQQSSVSQETKKQRQNKKKAEEAKAQREADEQQRKVLLEQQRRTAREARGEAAKNGLQPTKGPATNAWSNDRSKSGAAGGSRPAAPSQEGHFLDTFDAEVNSTASSNENVANGTPATTDSLSNSAQWANLPSEEEQLRMAMADSEWTTVPKGKKGRKNKANIAGDTASEQGSESNVPQSPIKTTPTQSTEAFKPQTRYDVLDDVAPVAQVSHPLDSDWPVV